MEKGTSPEEARTALLKYIAWEFQTASLLNEGSRGSRRYIFTTVKQVEGLKSHGKKMLLDYLPLILLKSGLLKMDDLDHQMLFRHVCLLRKVLLLLERDFVEPVDFVDLDASVASLLDSYNYYDDCRLNTHFLLHASYFSLVLGPPTNYWTFSNEEEHKTLKFFLT
jgi:hypothetical protein